MNCIVLLCLSFFTFSHSANADVCTPVRKVTKYQVQKSDQVAALLRALDLEPVFGTNGSLQTLQKINQIKNPNFIEPGTEIILPLKCEENIRGYKVKDRGADRLLVLEKSSAIGTTSDSVTTTDVSNIPLLTPIERKTLDILDEDIPTGPQISTEGAPNEDQVSEALRYRMICEGEWTGTECITRYSVIYLAGTGSYYRYDSTDATTGGEGVLLSKFNPGISAGWSNYWFENFKTDLGASFQLLNINEDALGRSIDQSKKTISNAYAYVKYETGFWGLSAGLQQYDKAFYRFDPQNIFLFIGGGVVVQLVPVTQTRAAVSYLVHQAGKYRFDAEVGLYSLTGGRSSGYSVKAGSGWDFSFSVQHDRVKEYLFGTVKFGKSQQDTTIEKQKQTDLSLAFGYAWKLKDW